MKLKSLVVVGVMLCLGLAGGHAAAQHPLDPLTADEILAAANILLDAGAARRGAIFQAIDLREPAKELVLGSESDGAGPRRATVFFRQDKKSFRTVVNLTNRTFTRPVEIPISEGQLGLTIQELFDFSFVFSDAGFLAAMARRGIDTEEELARLFVTPLTPGSFGLPEEQRRIVKAQMYTGYVLHAQSHGHLLLRKEDFRRAQFIEHALWVTVFNPDERFAAGDTPNQNPGEPGLPQYVANNERIVGRDLVLWHTVTLHHVTAAEDFPVLPRERAAFELKPTNFFDRNPALDLQRAPFEVP